VSPLEVVVGKVVSGVRLPPSLAEFLPKAIENAGPRAIIRWVEFFTANIANANTRLSYAKATSDFFDWLADYDGIDDVVAVTSLHLATYREWLVKVPAARTTKKGVKERQRTVATVKQRLSAIRSLFAFLKEGGVIDNDPAAGVKAPRETVRVGKTPVLSSQDAGKLLSSIEKDTLTGLRDRALIGLMTFSFARISAALAMKVGDVFYKGDRRWVRLHEKGGKYHEMPCHHVLEEYLGAYLEAGDFEEDAKGPLFRSLNRKTHELDRRPLHRANAWDMVRRRARQAGIKEDVCNHTFRGTGITTYLENGGELERAADMANHADTRTTRLYDRRNKQVTIDDVSRIRIFKR